MRLTIAQKVCWLSSVGFLCFSCWYDHYRWYRRFEMDQRAFDQRFEERIGHSPRFE